MPTFPVGFIALVALNSTGALSAGSSGALSRASRRRLVAAIAGLGVKTSFQQLAALGWRPVALTVGETVFLAGAEPGRHCGAAAARLAAATSAATTASAATPTSPAAAAPASAGAASAVAGPRGIATAAQPTVPAAVAVAT